MHGILAN